MFRFSLHKLAGLACVWLVASWLAAPSRAVDGQGKWVAGHRVLRTYNDDNNSGVRVNGSRLIFQDRSGRYWICDYRGVYLFDEERNVWRHFTRAAGELVRDEIVMIGESSDGTIWFVPNPLYGPVGVALSWYDGKTWQTIDRKARHPLLNRGITALFPSRDGRLWFALAHELVAYDGKRWSGRINLAELIEGRREKDPWQIADEISKLKRGSDIYKLDNDHTFKIYSGLQDRDGFIWLGTASGIFRFDENMTEWKRYPQAGQGGRHSMYEDRLGRIWFSDKKDKLYVHDKATNQWTSYNLRDSLSPDDKEFLGVNAVFQNRRGHMMVATFEGLMIFDEVQKTWEVLTSKNSDLPSSTVYTIVENAAGNIMVATGKGILVLEQ